MIKYAVIVAFVTFLAYQSVFSHDGRDATLNAIGERYSQMEDL